MPARNRPPRNAATPSTTPAHRRQRSARPSPAKIRYQKGELIGTGTFGKCYQGTLAYA